ncbi:hypothetical protein Tco_0298084, partial [Tanacetum coccineum]
TRSGNLGKSQRRVAKSQWREAVDAGYQTSKDHLLEQVIDNPTNPVQTRQQLATDPKMCMFALIVSTEESKNSKEEMVDSAWIKAMQDELH